MKKVPTDKVLHFIVSLILAIIASTVIANVTLAIGVWKEICDRKQAGNHFCRKDLAADFAGAAIGSAGAFITYII